jgi:hypothetical protein
MDCDFPLGTSSLSIDLLNARSSIGEMRDGTGAGSLKEQNSSFHTAGIATASSCSL